MKTEPKNITREIVMQILRIKDAIACRQYIQEIILGKNGPDEIGTKRTNMAMIIATPATNHEDQTVEM